MGRPMAQVLRTAGFDVVGMDVSPEMRELFDGAVAPSLLRWRARRSW
jgi:3-hydroxyisobutyrate dehydrogenase-like beta-hydroxyacid dehydrogenase